MFSFSKNFAVENVMYSDFITNQVGEEGYSTALSGGTIDTSVAGDATHPGVVTCAYVSAATDRSLIRFAVSCHNIGGGDHFMEFITGIVTLSNVTDEYVFFCGWYDGTSADAVDGVYFEYDRATNGDFWAVSTSNNSSRTKTALANAVQAATYVRLGIEINAAGTRVKFFLNGALVATHTTNIPTGTARVTTPCWGFRKTAGTGAANVAGLDRWTLRHSLTTPSWTA